MQSTGVQLMAEVIDVSNQNQKSNQAILKKLNFLLALNKLRIRKNKCFF
jgi:hypothetical protein